MWGSHQNMNFYPSAFSQQMWACRNGLSGLKKEDRAKDMNLGGDNVRRLEGYEHQWKHMRKIYWRERKGSKWALKSFRRKRRWAISCKLYLGNQPRCYRPVIPSFQRQKQKDYPQIQGYPDLHSDFCTVRLSQKQTKSSIRGTTVNSEEVWLFCFLFTVVDLGDRLWGLSSAWPWTCDLKKEFEWEGECACKAGSSFEKEEIKKWLQEEDAKGQSMRRGVFPF